MSDRLKSDMFDFFLELFDESAVLVVNMAKANKLDQITQELVKLMDTTKVIFFFKSINNKFGFLF